MLGLDFGTTNSAVGVASRDGTTRLATFGSNPTSTTFRSVLHFSGLERKPQRRPVPTTGPDAIAAYLDEGAGGRFLQSLKSHLASRHLTEAWVFGWKLDVEELVAILLAALREAARAQLGDPGEVDVVGQQAELQAAGEGAQLRVDLGDLGQLVVEHVDPGGSLVA